MNKNNEKTRFRFNTLVVNLLAEKYGFSDRYIKQILSGDRSPIFADQVKKDHKELINSIKENINNHIKK